MGAGGRAIALAPKQPLVEDQLFYVGVRDAIDPSPHDPTLAHEIKNMVITDPFVGQGINGRPGFVLAQGQLAAAEIQCIHQFSKLDGTEYTIAVCGGELYVYDWSLGTWSKEIDTTDLSGASVTFQTTGRVFAVTFANGVVFSDGVNKPFSWDGSSGSGLTALPNAAVFYGQPVVYYAKLFGIKDTERTTIVWSEENQPNTGYEAGGYNNAWTLGQTDQDALYSLIPTNEALFYTRARSMGAITGRVTANFQTTGTHEGVDRQIGSVSPGGWEVVGDTIYFVDSDARIQTVRIGAGITRPEVWRPARIGLNQAGTAATQLAKAQVVYHPEHTLVVAGLVMTTGTEIDQTFNFNPLNGKYAGHWDGMAAEAFAMVIDEDGRPTLMFGDDDGYVFYQAHKEDSVWSDRNQANTKVAIDHVLEGGVFGYDNVVEKILDRLDVAFVGVDLSTVSLKITTERGTQDSGLTWTGVASSTSVWDTMTWDEDVWDGGDVTQVRKSFGLSRYGRWFRARLEHEQLDEEFGVMSLTAEMYAEGRDVKMP